MNSFCVYAQEKVKKFQFVSNKMQRGGSWNCWNNFFINRMLILMKISPFGHNPGYHPDCHCCCESIFLPRKLWHKRTVLCLPFLLMHTRGFPLGRRLKRKGAFNLQNRRLSLVQPRREARASPLMPKSMRRMRRGRIQEPELLSILNA